MATNGDLEDLEDLITCAVCVNILDEPRSLICHHVYCKSCLEQLAIKRANVSVECPVCRKVTPLLAGGVAGLPASFHKNSLIECVNKMKFKSDAEKKEKVFSCCTLHSNLPCDLYCHKCDQYVCRDCTLNGETHDGHTCDKIVEVAKNFRQTFYKEFSFLVQKQEVIAEAVEKVQKSQQTLHDRCEAACRKIAESYDEIIRIVEEKKRKDIERFQDKYKADTRLTEMNSHAKALSSTLDEISSVQRRVEHEDNDCDDVYFMESRKALLREIIQTRRCINTLPADLPDHETLHVCAPTLGSGLCEAVEQKVARMYKFVAPLKCTVGPIQGETVNEKASVTIRINDSDGCPCQLQQRVQVELQPLNNSEVSIKAKVSVHSSSHYEAYYKPTLETRGHCQLNIKINGDTISQQMFIQCPPEALDKPVHFFHGIKDPGCLQIMKEKLLVICTTKDGERCIMSININQVSNGCVSPIGIKAPKKYKEWCPVEIEFCDEDNVFYVTDGNYNKVHKFTASGKCIRSIGGRGHDPVKFNGPNGLCIARDSLYICDSENHRVQVFDRHLQFIRLFGSRGSEVGQLNWPDNIVFDPNSQQIFVSELKNNRVQCFRENGRHIGFIGGHGSGPGEFIKPNILQIYREHVYVTDIKGVSVFTTCGQFIIRFSSMCSAIHAKSIDGFAIDKEGYRYVSDQARNRVVVF